jgi:hypothetical protein
VGLLIPAGIATDETTSHFFRYIVSSSRLHSLWGFENEDRIFPDVNNTTKFCLLTIGGTDSLCASGDFVFFSRQVGDLQDEWRHFKLSPTDLNLFNPNTGTCPTFRGKKDAVLSRVIYKRVPVLKHGEREQEGWAIDLKQGLFSMASDSNLFHAWPPDERMTTDGTRIRLYESKMFHVYDHRFGTYIGQTQAQSNKGFLPQLSDEQHKRPDVVAAAKHGVNVADVDKAIPARWNHDWFLGWRAICRSVDERTLISAVLPKTGVGNSTILCFPANADPLEVAALLANLCSFCFDYCARQKIGGSNMSHFISEQLPVLPQSTYAQPCAWDGADSLLGWIGRRVMELTYTSFDVGSFASDCGYTCTPFIWDADRRFQIRCEVDAAFLHLYLPATDIGAWDSKSVVDSAYRTTTPIDFSELTATFPVPLDAVRHILDSFPVVRRKEEEKYGHYRSKETILRIYDQLTEAIRTGTPYQSPLDPPPGDARCCHPNDPDAAAHFAPRPDPKPHATSVPPVSKTASTEVRRGPGRPPKSAANDGQATEAILAYLKSNAGMHGKSAILEGTGIDAAEWNAAIKQLVDEGKVKKEGEKKGARYQHNTLP